MGGLDALVFTAGIGERAAPVRAAVCARLGWLGIGLCPRLNADNAVRISHPGSGPSVWVIPTDEELMIAIDTLAVLSAAQVHEQRTEYAA